jgi:hypothetical protein
MMRPMSALTDLSFEEWIDHAFGHEVRFERPEWYWDDDIDFWRPPPDQAVDYLTRLFENAPEHLTWFSDAQAAQGLSYLVNTSVGMHPDLWNPGVPVGERERLSHSVAIFFRDFMMPRCEPRLGHLSEPGPPLNMRAYMWWDGFPATWSPDDPDRTALVAAEMSCLSDVLSLDSVACQEAALHGLGHWARDPHAGPAAMAVIDAYLERGAAPRDELLSYARAARTGCIL